MRTLIIASGLLVVVGLAGGGLLVSERMRDRAPVAAQSTQAATVHDRQVFGRRAAATGEGDWKTLSGRPVPPSLGRRGAGTDDRTGNEAPGDSRDRGSGGSPGGPPGGPSDGSAIVDASAPRHRPGEALVANPPAGFESWATALGFLTLEVAELRRLDLRLHRMRVPPRMPVADAVQALRGRFPGVIADANHLYDVSSDPSLPDSYARTLIGWQSAPADCGRGIRLGMIDTGIELQHPALVGADIDYRIFNNPARPPGPPDHGTAVAALLVGRPVKGKGWGGLLPGARLSAANIFEMTEDGRMLGSAGGFLRAVDWLAERRVHVVNMSIAGPDNQVVRAAMGRARALGLVLVAAAGNNGSAAEPAYPAAYPEVIAVTAIDSEKQVYRYANRGGYIDFAAPGVHIWTASPGGGRYQSGTSFASPYVSVLSALAIADGLESQPDLIRAFLRQDAVDLGPPGRDSTFGWGLVGTPAHCVR